MNKPRVLIADSDESSRFAVAGALETLHLGIDSAVNSEQLLRYIEQRKYALVLMDLLKSGEGGLSVLEQLHDSRPEIPLVVVTAHGTVQSEVRAIKFGAIEYLQKPVSPDELQSLVARVLEHGRLTQSEADCYASQFERAKRCLIQKHKDAAIEHLRRAIAISPERPEAYNLLGTIHELRGELHDALNDYRVAWTLDATYEPSRSNLERATGADRQKLPIALGEIRDWSDGTAKEVDAGPLSH